MLTGGFCMVDKAQIIRAVEIITRNSSDYVIEVRALPRDKGSVVGGYFKNKTKLAEEVERIDASEQYKGIYITLNPVRESLYAQSPDIIKPMRQLANDSDILKRMWLPIDFDPVRPSNTSSTDEEHLLAIQKAREVSEFMRHLNWPEPVLADSGNGAHLLYMISMPNTEDSTRLIERCLTTISALFSDDRVSIDRSVFNASRIWKLYGTCARKGESTAERPWRYAKIIDAPVKVLPLSKDTIKEFVELFDTRSQSAMYEKAPPTNAVVRLKVDAEEWIKSHGLEVHKTKTGKIGKIYVLRVCPMNPEHDDRSACIIQTAEGNTIFRCHHDHCKGYTMLDVLKKYGEYDSSTGATTRTVEVVSKGEALVTGKDGGPIVIRREDVTREARNGAIVFSPTRASEIITDKVYNMVTDKNGVMWVYNGRVYVPDTTTNMIGIYIDRIFNTVAGDMYNKNMKSETIEKIKARTYREDIEWNSNPNHFCVANGILDLKTGELLDFDSGAYLTLESPIVYDPDAKCQAIWDFLKTTLPTYGDILTVIDMFVMMSRAVASGYFAVLIGPGSNGKLTIEELMKAYVGKSNYSMVRIEQLDSQFARYDLINKRLLLNAEVENSRETTTWIKMIATGDELDAEVKHRHGRIKFKPFCFIVIDTNVGQRFEDNTYGLARRLIKLDFPYKFVDNPDPNNPNERKKDPYLQQKVTKPCEISGFLNVILKRAPHVIETGQVYRSRSGERMMMEYDLQANSHITFTDEFVQFTPNGKFMPTKEIYRMYTQYCNSINITPKKINILGRTISKHHHVSPIQGIYHGERCNGFMGISIDEESLNRFMSDMSTRKDPENVVDTVRSLFRDHVYRL